MYHQDRHKLTPVESVVKKTEILAAVHGFLVAGRRNLHEVCSRFSACCVNGSS